MFDNPLPVAFVIVMVSMTCTGAYCAHKLTGEHPCWVRMIVMAPAIMGMFAPVLMLLGLYVPYEFDVVFACAVALLYALVASRFTSRPWLDIRTTKR
jgi:uncharacterized protein (DUF983 family)